MISTAGRKASWQAIDHQQPLTGVIGAYHFKQYSNDIAGVELNPLTPGARRDTDDSVVDNKNWTAFTHWTFNINERLAVTVGGCAGGVDLGVHVDWPVEAVSDT